MSGGRNMEEFWEARGNGGLTQARAARHRQGIEERAGGRRRTRRWFHQLEGATGGGMGDPVKGQNMRLRIRTETE